MWDRPLDGPWSRSGARRGLEAGLRLQLVADRFGDSLRRAVAILVVAPAPLRQVVVGSAEAALGRELVDPLLEVIRHLQRHVGLVVLGLDLRRDLLPVEDSVARHQAGTSVRPEGASFASRRNRSTAADAFCP